MTEGIKTLIYVGVALLVALVAFLSRPRIEEFKVSELESKACSRIRRPGQGGQHGDRQV